jgi:cytochrome c553
MKFQLVVGKMYYALAAVMLATGTWAAPVDPIFTNQGAKWTPSARRSFYSRDQGSRIMPYQWIAALKQPNGEPFMGDSLSRYGYLPNNASSPPGLPVGFTVSSGDARAQAIGMTCSACHTRQIVVDNIGYRVDGGPAIVDFQTFLTDLDSAVHSILGDVKNFEEFAISVLGQRSSLAARNALRSDVEAWYKRFDTLLKGALPTRRWGPARVDAVGMIFNRLTSLDLGPPPTFLIAENIRRADAPVRYPFLWNAAIQDKTQWPGFAENGNDILGLARNLGEVYGVFADFHPSKSSWHALGVDYWNVNSADFQGLEALEDLIRDLGPPKWPWAINEELAAKGKVVFDRNASAGGCAECHSVQSGPTRFPNAPTWETPIQDVGTDSREYDILGWTAQTGVLNGAKIPFVSEPLKPTDTAFRILQTAVTGSILQYYVPVALRSQPPLQIEKARAAAAPETESLRDAFKEPKLRGPNAYAYESRVLQGIWATAPYLHNGSVPTLADLLKPVGERAVSFKVGPKYDTANVGLAAEQDKFDYVLTTTDCGDRNSGNSRCGHEFGISLSNEEKQALLEYLKAL